jgi:hypothetical protein
MKEFRKMSPSTASTWLKACSAVLLVGLGLLFAIAAHPAAAGIATLFADLLYWPMDGTQSMAAPETRIMLAIGGGITVGWGVTIWQIADRIMPKDPALARAILLPGMIAWFVTDSTCSWFAGAPLNIALNAVFLIAFTVPLWRAKPAISG